MERSIWSDGVYGMIFDGYDLDLDAEVNPITSMNTIVIIRKSGGGTEYTEQMLVTSGLTNYEVYIIRDDLESVKDCVNKYSGKQDVILLFENVSLLKKYKSIFKDSGIRCQTVSVMKTFYEYIRPNLIKASQLLEDDLSRNIFTEVLNVRFKVKPNEALYKFFDKNQYFPIPEMNQLDVNGVYVDCGAFVGDTVESFIQSRQGIFSKIYAFEPAPRQYRALLSRKQRLLSEWALGDEQIVCLNVGVGSHTAKASMHSGVLSNHIIGTSLTELDESLSEKVDTVDIVALDDVCGSENVRFIKADVEGFEMDMLKGAEKIISEQKPCLAICLYHKLTDYFEIPLYIKSLVPEYKMKVRHHSSDFTETVLYCYC
ncbi:MAG: FkbM family methyltransferase [Selenomonadaceae bacterium]|nr:FkbM family methyltransferase [Selenomonadaceae bacterium]